MEAYSPDGFKTVTLRADRTTTSAVVEGIGVLHLNDSLTVVVTNVLGCDPASLLFGIFSAADAPLHEGCPVWQFVPGCVDKVYATVSLASAEATALAATLEAGESVDVYLNLAESGGRTWVDIALPFRESPAVSGGSGEAATQYLPRAALASVASEVAAMPTLTAAQREARFAKLIQRLAEIAS